MDTKMGMLTNLDTNSKDDLVDAINELYNDKENLI